MSLNPRCCGRRYMCFELKGLSIEEMFIKTFLYNFFSSNAVSILLQINQMKQKISKLQAKDEELKQNKEMSDDGKMKLYLAPPPPCQVVTPFFPHSKLLGVKNERESALQETSDKR